MMAERPAFERRVMAALEAVPPRIPVLLGGCGSGRTSVLLRLREQMTAQVCQYVDVDRVATMPECFLRAVTEASPFPVPAGVEQGIPAPSARDAFAGFLAFVQHAQAPGGQAATFMLDEVLELRTFESYPGLRGVMAELIAALGSSRNRFVLTSRYTHRTHRLLREASPQFEVIHVSPLNAAEVAQVVRSRPYLVSESESDDLARAMHALTDGRPRYIRAMVDLIAGFGPQGVSDPVSALVALLAPHGALDRACQYCYELRLHRARGYGALKAILGVLAAEEPLTLTEIAQRLTRTPGSTKDYLSWLEDVDLVTARRKRYSFTDPVLRLWVRLYGRPVPPGDDDVAREVRAYALARLPKPEAALALAGPAKAPVAPDGSRDRTWGSIEID
jgi:hypothetical protein